MTWFKVDDGFSTSRKVLSIPKRRRAVAVGVWTLAGNWAARELSDGHVPQYVLDEIPSARQATPDLCSAKLWDKVHDGIVFRNWEQYQRSRVEVESERADHIARQKAYRDRKRQERDASLDRHVTHNVTHNVTPPLSGSDGGSDDVPTRPDPTHVVSNEVSSDVTSVDAIDENGPRSQPVSIPARKLARAYTDVIKLSDVGKVCGVVANAQAAGYSDDQITKGLRGLANDKRSVTPDTLRIEIEGTKLPDGCFIDDNGVLRAATGRPLAGKNWQE